MADMETKSVHLEIKEVDDEGRFSGYGSIFGNKDSYGDVVEKGAFANFLIHNRVSSVKLLWQHDSSEPIGVYDQIIEDDRGLYVSGRLLVKDIARAREAHALLKVGAIEGLSIGFRINAGGAAIDNDGTRHLTDLQLFEISIVTFPANQMAQVSNVKSIKTIREFEKFLRDAGFSKSEACGIALHGYKQRDAAADEELAQSINNLIQSFKEA